jgi:hypothetical protein
MTAVMEKDLKKVLSTDVEQLKMELEYAQMSVEKQNRQALPKSPQSDSEGDMDDDTRKSLDSK